MLATADLVLSRAGANAICEILALRKPNILIPLPAAVSRGDQILNAKSFEKQGFSCVLEEENITNDLLLSTIRQVYAQRSQYIEKMEQSSQSNGVDRILQLIEECAASKKK